MLHVRHGCSTCLCGRFPQQKSLHPTHLSALFHLPLRQISTAVSWFRRLVVMLFHLPLRQISTAEILNCFIESELFHLPLRQISTAKKVMKPTKEEAVPPAFAADFHSEQKIINNRDFAVPPAFAADFHSGDWTHLGMCQELFHLPLRQISTA